MKAGRCGCAVMGGASSATPDARSPPMSPSAMAGSHATLATALRESPDIGLVIPRRASCLAPTRQSTPLTIPTMASVPNDVFVLIAGRTSRQGCGISEGKLSSDNYREETTTLQMSPQDMRRLGLVDGDWVRLRSEFGTVEVPVAAAKADELPPGVLFIAYGDLSSRLMGADTHGSGMPTSKGLDVTLEKRNRPGSSP